MKAKPIPQATYTIVVTAEELTRIVSGLEYLEKRLLFLANMASNQGREAEAQARIDSAGAAANLSARLYAISAGGVK